MSSPPAYAVPASSAVQRAQPQPVAPVAMELQTDLKPHLAPATVSVPADSMITWPVRHASPAITSAPPAARVVYAIPVMLLAPRTAQGFAYARPASMMMESTRYVQPATIPARPVPQPTAVPNATTLTSEPSI